MLSDKETDKRIGACLKEEREKRELSLEYVGKSLGVTRATVHFWETGRNAISASALKRYCDVLNLPLDKFARKVFNNL